MGDSRISVGELIEELSSNLKTLKISITGNCMTAKGINRVQIMDDKKIFLLTRDSRIPPDITVEMLLSLIEKEVEKSKCQEVINYTVGYRDNEPNLPEPVKRIAVLPQIQFLKKLYMPSIDRLTLEFDKR